MDHDALVEDVRKADHAYREAQRTMEARIREAAAVELSDLSQARDEAIARAVSAGVPKRRLYTRPVLGTTSPSAVYDALKRVEDSGATITPLVIEPLAWQDGKVLVSARGWPDYAEWRKAVPYRYPAETERATSAVLVPHGDDDWRAEGGWDTTTHPVLRFLFDNRAAELRAFTQEQEAAA